MRQHKKLQMLFLVLRTYGCLLSHSHSLSNLHRALGIKCVCVRVCAGDAGAGAPPGWRLPE